MTHRTWANVSAMRVAVALLGVAASACGGEETPASAPTNTAPPEPAGPPPAAYQLEAGEQHVCALRVADGTVRCWGGNNYGQLGMQSPSTVRATREVIPGLRDVTQLASTDYTTCALLRDGTVQCWGRAQYGQLGDGSTADRFAPGPVPGLANVAELTGGMQSFCARLRDGTVSCWGPNMNGEAGGSGEHPQPTAVAGVAGAVQLAAGNNHTCARLENGTVSCWGRDPQGSGGAERPSSGTPTTIPGIDDAEAVFLGSQVSCIRRRGGEVRCFGWNMFNALPGVTEQEVRQPTVVAAFANAQQIAIGSGMFGCLLDGSGQPKCWGTNSFGMLGDATEVDKPAPVDVSGITNARSIHVMGQAACALTMQDEVRCWGANGAQQLGSEINGSNVPVPVAL
jgi:alpha-tubulin suppressor-like RCC1 family protein